MAQDYGVPLTTDTLAAGRQKIEDSLAALRSSFSGTSAPTTPVDGQLWYDSTNHILSVRANGAWEVVPHGIALYTGNYQFAFGPATYNTPKIYPIFVAETKMEIVSASFASSKDSTGSTGANYWACEIYNMTQLNALSSTIYDSFNDAEVSKSTANDLQLDQNLTIAAGDIIGMRITSGGTPTTMLGEQWAVGIKVKPNP